MKNIDVYSLGMLMPVLFYNVGLLEKIKESEIIKRFFAFFGLMANTYAYCRMKIDEAYLLYNAMLTKYKKSGCKTKNPLDKSLKYINNKTKKNKKPKKENILKKRSKKSKLNVINRL